MDSTEADKTFRPIFLKISPEQIVRLKFTLESYEGLGIVRTLSAERGEIVVLSLSDTEKYVREILHSLEEELGFAEIARPESVDGDWLFAEEVLKHT